VTVRPKIPSTLKVGDFSNSETHINTMVDQLKPLRIGSDARRGARKSAPRASSAARPKAEVAGTWKDLTDNVNFMASHLTAQVRKHRRSGDRDRAAERTCPKEDPTSDGPQAKSAAQGYPELRMVEQLRSFAAGKVTPQSRAKSATGKTIGRSGRVARRRRQTPGNDLTDKTSIARRQNTSHSGPANIAGSPRAVARGGPVAQDSPSDVKGEILELQKEHHPIRWSDQLNAFAGRR